MPTPTPRRLFFLLAVVVVALFLRPPTTNFVFDEQEALLGNPYLQGSSSWLDAWSLDFWGREPSRTIGSYRPLPNLLWWPLSPTLSFHTPWVFVLHNLFFHTLNCFLLALCVRRLLSRSPSTRASKDFVAAGAGLFLASAGVLSEAVCAAEGLADVLVGFFLLLFAWLVLRTSVGQAPRNKGVLAGKLFAAAACCFFLGILSKETMLAGVVVFPLFVLVGAPVSLGLASRFLASLIAVAGVGTALVAFAVLRQFLFPARLADVEQIASTGLLQSFLDWFGQPKMPADPINNPLFEASTSERLATAAELLAKQIGQIVVPTSVSGDYSFPSEVPGAWGALSLGGGAFALGLLLVCILLCARSIAQGDTAPVVSVAALGTSVLFFSYLPVSNALVLLPTVRAERLLYSPTIGVAFLFAAVLVGLARHWGRGLWVFALSYLLFQGACARVHSLRYVDDVAFWRSATEVARPSAKAHLNLGVMLGARGDEESRLNHTRRAVELAPDWAMGRVYLGDSYCRLDKMDEAWAEYRIGFSASPNSKALTALGLQCLWDHGAFDAHKHELMDLAAKSPGSWLDYFVDELRLRGDTHAGIPPLYRPRQYNARARSNPQ